MDERRVAEYFLVAGLPPNPQPLAEFSCDGAPLKSTHSLPPVTDIGVVNKSLGEIVPDGYTCIEYTIGGIPANLNSGVLRSQEIYIYYRRGRDKPPLVDIGVLLESRERLLPDSQVVEFTAGNHNANINHNGVAAYITYRRATEENTCNELVVSDICIIITNKGEKAPHSYCTIERNLNKGTVVGADVFLCYKKSVNRTNYLAYNAGILDSYPFDPRPNFPLPDNLALFCLPMGATLESWPRQAKMPQHVFSTFVLTILPASTSTSHSEPEIENVEKVYGAAITFYERYPHDKLTLQQRNDLLLNEHFGRRNLIHTNKCICILSLWPFFDTFEKFLKYLHRMALTGTHKVPIERYIWHMLECVPFPNAHRPRILIQLDFQEGITLAQPEDSPISLSGASFRKLVMCLRPEGCLLVLLYALTEQKILLHSLRPNVLTAVAEALTMIIFPFHWQCPYIPLCPLGLSDFLDAPTPFLLGLDSRFFDLYDPPLEVICIDLDTAAISIPEDKKNLTTKLLPKKAARVLKSSLDNLCSTIKSVDDQLQEHHMRKNIVLDQCIDIDFKMKRRERELEVEIQDTFLRFTATILKGYSQYLLPIITVKLPEDSGTPVLFDVEGFVRSREKMQQKFYEMLVSTQMFSRFIEERSFVSDKDASLVFFDDCIERVRDDDSSIKLLEVEPVSNEHTYFLLPPEPPLHSPIDGYAYEGFPKLRKELFPKKDPLPAIPPEFLTPQRQKGPGTGIPGSPLARRSKHELKSAQKLTSKYYQTPLLWAKCLMSTCFSLWFAHLPSFITVHTQKGRVLDLAFYILQRVQKLSLTNQDEVCYRVMMQLCGVYSKPVIAVKTLCEMRNAGIIPNAITYGYYNRALLESRWNPSNLLWNKLRNVMLGVSAFRQSGLERSLRRRSLEEADLSNDSASRISIESASSIESQQVTQFKTDTLSSDPGYCSVSENCEQVNISPSSTNTTSTYNEVDIMSRSGSNLSLSSPVQESVSTINANRPPSSCDTSHSSTTPTVAYDTAPSSPLSPPNNPSFTHSLLVTKDPQNYHIGLPSSGTPTNLIAHEPDFSVSSHNCSPSTVTTTTTDCRILVNEVYDSRGLSSCTVTPLKSKTNLPLSATSPSHTRSSPSNTLDFRLSDKLRKRLGCIVCSSSAGLASGVRLSLLETHPILVNSAGLLMTSPLDASCLSPQRKPTPKPTDLAKALSETLEKYDQIQEPSMPLRSSYDHTEKGPPDNVRSQTYGKDEKFVKKLLNLVYPLDDPSGVWYDYDEVEQPSDLASSSSLPPTHVNDVTLTNNLISPQKAEGSKIINDLVGDHSSDRAASFSQPGAASSGVKTFFTRNTPERISSLWKKGVLGADERLKGMWKKNLCKTSSKEDLNTDLPVKAPESLIKEVKSPVSVSPTEDFGPVIKSVELENGCKKDSGSLGPLAKSTAKMTFRNERPLLEEKGGLTSFEESLPKNEKEELTSIKYSYQKVPGKGNPALENEKEDILSPKSILSSDSNPFLSAPVVGEAVVESGRQVVLSGDPLGALNSPPAGVAEWNTLSFSTPLTPSVMSDPFGEFDDPYETSMHEYSVNSPLKPPLPCNKRIDGGRRISRKSLGRVGRNKHSLTSDKSHSTSNLLSAPFSGEEFKFYNQPLTANKPSTEVAAHSSLLFGLSGTNTFGLASSIATQGLQQASKRIETLRTNYLDPAMTELVNQSNFNSRRNEIISGSISSMRLAVTSLSKKYTSLRDAIINTPQKQSWKNGDGEDDSLDGFWERRGSYEATSHSSEEHYRPSSLPRSTDAPKEMMVDRSLPSSWSQTGPFCLGIWITSCSMCHNCQELLYDEEIMAGWRPDDSNLNTRCWHCDKVTVPFLTVSIYYLRHLPKPTNERLNLSQPKEPMSPQSRADRRRGSKKDGQEKNAFEIETINHIEEKGIPLEPLTVPYLSPLVLRKEMETVLGHDGDTSLSLQSFPEQHPILYWNLLWYFSRLRLPTHLSSLCLSSLPLLKDKPIHEMWKEADWRHVFVRCLWDNVKYHQERGAPLYMQWKEHRSPSSLVEALTPHRAAVSKSLLESYLTLLHFNQVGRCLELMSQTLRKGERASHYPIYRDLFFFALTVLPRNEINIIAFEQEFRREFDKIQPMNSTVLCNGDGPPPIPAIFCRKFFWDLSL